MPNETTSDGSVSRRKFLVGAGTAGLLGVAGCTSNPNANGGGGDGGNGGAGTGNGGGKLSGSIDIAGSSTVFPLATAMRNRFNQKHPSVNISIKSTGSGGGFANHFCPGNTDFNNASRPIKQEEKAQCKKNDVNPVELKVATDALTVVVHPEADWLKDDCITVDELSKIWNAKSKPQKWSDVKSSWPDKKLDLFGPTDASGTFDYFKEEIIGEEGSHRSDYQATEQDNQIISGVSQSEYAMGYLGFAYYSENKDRVKALGIDNGSGCVKPSIKTAKSGDYQPLSRPLFTYPAQESLKEKQVAAFAKFWLRNSTSSKIVAKEVGYIPNSEEEKNEQMKRLEQAIKKAQGN